MSQPQYLQPITRGAAWAVLATCPQADLAAVPLYLFLSRKGGPRRLRLKYDPAAGDNDGVLEVHAGTPAVAFRLAAERTRAADFPDDGLYEVHVHVGPLAGDENLGRPAGWVVVRGLADGGPVA